MSKDKDSAVFLSNLSVFKHPRSHGCFFVLFVCFPLEFQFELLSLQINECLDSAGNTLIQITLFFGYLILCFQTLTVGHLPSQNVKEKSFFVAKFTSDFISE